ncbi:NADP-dependent oxidoreductase domain-containing protein [Talaromyces proteolyticus]|uniref:NADP-dependent oxidoreductase domain-containing protein n=1 Tax=Talaromyces proteolyticus TaxID=1131652 RepID=A0AAD4KU74_9EURO|nr:NADP-dependent oxidoreductase domain-containing protein [Talaromyces proteolyticus]KAH8700962.1 NADP-dependent oxidoreductase domain-containing protein [Talaromyces proteolyticus]
MTTNHLRVIYGGADWTSANGFTPDRICQILKYLAKEGVLIGKTNVATFEFQINTKIPGGLWPHVEMTKENVIRSRQGSFKTLGVDQVDIYYIHAPGRKIPLKETLEGINELYKSGAFKYFEIEEVISIAKENKFVLPSVYQGFYNAVGRRVETDIFPILRKNNMSFHAYAPLGGGFLAKKPQDIAVNPKGRFASDHYKPMFNILFNKTDMLEFMAGFGKIAQEEGISQAELAYRWLRNHSFLRPELGDAVIIGCSYGRSLKIALEWLKAGPLSDTAVNRLDDIWKGVEKNAVLDVFNDLLDAGYTKAHLFDDFGDMSKVRFT